MLTSLLRDNHIWVLALQQYVEGFVWSKLDMWKKAILSLIDIASSQPHAAYACFMYCLLNL